jgi:hypothetical protein
MKRILLTLALLLPYAQATPANILLERRKELALEGHRFFDLMRNG